MSDLDRIKDLEFLVANLVDALNNAQSGLDCVERQYGDTIYGVSFRRVESRTKTMLALVDKYHSENKDNS